jgi:alpha-ribazole phosphatase
MRLLLVRHGETPWNAAGRFQGQTDVPLSPRGQRQAEAVARVMAAEHVHAVLASDLRRTQDTARPIATALGLPLQLDPRLREIAFGDWEGLTFDEIQSVYADLLAARQANPMHVAPPGGETLGQVTGRVRAALDHLRCTNSERTVVLVAHGGSLQVLVCLALGLSCRMYRQFVLHTGSVSELYVSPQDAVLMRLNDTHHLTEADHER